MRAYLEQFPDPQVHRMEKHKASSAAEAAPEALGPTAYHRSELAKGRFVIQRASNSGRCFFYPRNFEPGTGDADFTWIEPSGRAVVYSTTPVWRRPEQGGTFNIALVDLEEGPRMLTRIVGIDPEAVEIGMNVIASIEDVEGQTLVVYRPEDRK
ncbi:MAG: OB-fold domain-containing protein [Alphaproteobacteria bacterium]|nr:OB-fold domain-containing protein [Alphaproteobacteria bacterium]